MTKYNQVCFVALESFQKCIIQEMHVVDILIIDQLRCYVCHIVTFVSIIQYT